MQFETVIEDNQKLVYSLAYKFKNYDQLEDLFQVGKMGLIKAYENYDENKGAKFTTYAFPYVLGEMKKLVREDRGYKVSRDINTLNSKIEQAYTLLAQRLMREPSTLELANYLEVDESLIIQALYVNFPISSIDEPFNLDGKEMTLHDTIANEEKIDLDTLIALKSCLEYLTLEEQMLINYRYMNDLTQSQTADLLGINQVQVSRIEHKVLKKMRQYLVS